MSRNSEYKLRVFEDGDEAAIVQLFEKKYAKYGGYVPRTSEYWRWACLQRPDVEREGIFVVVDRNEAIAGYAVAGRSGNIWEFSYNPESDGENVLRMLLDASTRYLDKVGATSITLNAPTEDHVLSEACRNLGFVAVPPPRMFLTVQNIPELVSVIAGSKKDELGKLSEVILVKLKDAKLHANDKFFIQINKGEIVVAAARSHTIQIETDQISFSSVLFGISSPLRLMVRLKIRVRPFWKVFTLIKVLSSLKINSRWFYPLSDYG
jgi:hypothetical protein